MKCPGRPIIINPDYRLPYAECGVCHATANYLEKLTHHRISVLEWLAYKLYGSRR